MSFRISVLLSLLLLIGSACRKGDLLPGQAPDTRIAIEVINLDGENRLRSEVRLNWFGTDVDGYITAYEISTNQVNWTLTKRQDSTFLFPLPVGQTEVDIDFYVRAIDNDGLTDPTPAYLKIPIKNSPPTVRFLNDRGPKDTAFIAATFFWQASDADGTESIEKIEIKFNQGDWVEINRNQNLISALLSDSIQSGASTADLYYSSQTNAAIRNINGLISNGDNRVFIRATDVAGAQSAVDTAEVFYFKNKTAGTDLLWVNGHSQSIANQYRSLINGTGANYDLLNFGIDQGARQPLYWNPTFRLITTRYQKIFVNSSSAEYTNAISGQTSTLLEFMAPIVQGFTTSGGKIFATTSFIKNDDVSLLSGPFPIEGLVNSSGQARLSNDSSMVATAAFSQLPNLQPVNVQFGLVPIRLSADAQAVYRGQLSKLAGWQGDNLLGAGRLRNGRLSELLIAVEIHNYNANQTALQQLLTEVLINEF